MVSLPTRVRFCALGLFLFLPALGASGDREDAVQAKLSMQKALQRGRDMLAAQQYEEAVHVLEGDLDHIDGSREYLTVLRDAYRGYILQLKAAKRGADLNIYQQRLKVLDPGYLLDAASSRPAVAVTPGKTAPAVPSSVGEPKPLASSKSAEHAKAADVPPAGPSQTQKEARALVAKANDSFDNRQYELAAQHFEKANQIDPASVVDSHEKWAYCKLFRVVDQLKSSSTESTAPFVQLEREVHLAMSLAPNPEIQSFGKELLTNIQDRRTRKGSGNNETQGSSTVAIQHRAEAVDGWQVAETANLRVFHHQQRELAERVARLAEQTRVDMQRKWFGTTESWKPRCDIYLHANVDAYSAATKVSRSLPGHSLISIDPGRGVAVRQIHLRCDDLNMLIGTLPHEATHVVLGGRFGDKPIPRWADEGMAVLSEPRDRIELHLRNLPAHQHNRQLLHVSDLMQLKDYPEPQLIGGFYAKSVSLVDFLTHKREPRVFTEFVKEGMYKGYEPALKKYYGYNRFDELESDWNTYAFSGAGRVALEK